MISNRKTRFILLAVPLAFATGAGASAAGAQLDLARAALERRDFIAADVALDRAEEAGASTEQLAASRGETCLLEGDLECARKWLAPAKFADGESKRGLIQLARLERRSGNAGAAAKAYDAALEIDDRDADLWIDIAEFRYDANEEAIAFDAVAYALEIEPRLPRALALQARLIRQRDGLLPSLPFFVTAIDANPGDTGLILDYAAVLGEIGQANDFLDASRVAAENGGAPAALFQQSVLAVRARNFQLARDLMEKVPVGRDRSGAALLRPLIELEAGSLKNAQQLLQRLHEREPEDRSVARLYAYSLAQGDRNDAIVATFAELAEPDYADPYLKLAVARAYERLGEREKAGDLIDGAAPTEGEGYRGFPTFAASVGSVNYRKDARRFDYVREYVRALVGEDRASQARRVADNLVETFPNARNPRVLAGDAAFAAENDEEALEHYEKAASIRYTDRLLMRIVATLDLLDRQPEARSIAQSYLAKRPGSILATRIVAEQSANAGDWAMAKQLLDYLLRTVGGRDVITLSLASQAEANLGNHERARTLAERAMGMQPNNDLAAASLALALEKGGRSRKDAIALAGLDADGGRFPRVLFKLSATAASKPSS